MDVIPVDNRIMVREELEPVIKKEYDIDQQPYVMVPVDINSDPRDQEMNDLKAEKTNIINDLIGVKRQNNQMFLEAQENGRKIKSLQAEMKSLNDNIDVLKKEKEKDRNMISALQHENKAMSSKIKQLQLHNQNVVVINPEKKVQRKKRTKEKEYEVAKILKDRKVDGKTSFLVRWKNYSTSSDSWVDEKDLHCPGILQKYLKSKHNKN